LFLGIASFPVLIILIIKKNRGISFLKMVLQDTHHESPAMAENGVLSEE
jgi:hypothetical protein